MTMAPAFTLPAPAKLNLFLHILGRRPDGYHELQTLFQFLDWGDDLGFAGRDDGELHLHDGLPGGTRVPQPGRRGRELSGTGFASASRRELRETPSRVASWRSAGSFIPASRFCSSISARTRSAISSTRRLGMTIKGSSRSGHRPAGW